MDPSDQLPGHPTSEAELRSLGFDPLLLEIRGFLSLPDGIAVEWDTKGPVPDGPGHYLFTVETGANIAVAYVGLTGNLSMVTDGRLPGRPGARPGQRYGRPKYSGNTRRRVNIHIAEQLNRGRVVRHWVRALSEGSDPSSDLKDRLHSEEEALIVRWGLRQVGWNRG